MFARELQTDVVEPIPALRLLLVISCLALATVSFVNVLAVLVRATQRWHNQRPQQRRQQQQQEGKLEVLEARTVPVAASGCAAGDISSDGTQQEQQGKEQWSADATSDGQQQQQQQQQDEASVVGLGLDIPAKPDLPLKRGLSQRVTGYVARRPWLHRTSLALVLAVSMAAAGGCQLIAPGFVDAAIVQLVNSFGVVVVVVVQSALLRHRLPWPIWPCTVAMLAGALMVIVPSIGKVSAEAGVWRKVAGERCAQR